jgi:hypothetical protein
MQARKRDDETGVQILHTVPFPYVSVKGTLHHVKHTLHSVGDRALHRFFTMRCYFMKYDAREAGVRGDFAAE